MEAKHAVSKDGTYRAEASMYPPSEAADDFPAPAEQAERAFAVLGSRVRLRILEALSIRTMTLPELARELGLNRATLRYHISFLLEQGWARELPPDKTHGSGRPATRYRASPHAWVGFPQRHFEILGEIALKSLLESAGPERTATVLKAKGEAMGEQLIQGLRSRGDLAEWSPEQFEKLVLRGLFREFGVVGSVVSRAPSHITYRVYTCPFLELAEKMPGLVCDAMDAGFHEGIDRSTGRVATTKTACMGHGDPYCEYLLAWGPAERTSKQGRKGRRRT